MFRRNKKKMKAKIMIIIALNKRKGVIMTKGNRNHSKIMKKNKNKMIFNR